AHKELKPGDKAEAEWTFDLPPGKHQVAVLARSPDASAISEAVEVLFVKKEDLPVLHVLTIGVSKYRQKNLELAYAAKDAEDLLSGFQKVGVGELFREVRGQSLVDQKANRAAILAEIDALRKRVRP